MSKLEIPIAGWSRYAMDDLEKCKGQRAKRGDSYATHPVLWAMPQVIGGRIC
jgi:hypothetical protein